MKEVKTDEIRLRHIRDAIHLIEKFSAGKTKKDIYNDEMYRFAVERQLEIIGEAANNLSSDLVLSHEDVPWPQIISFRNFIVHEYFGLDLELVWNVVIVHLPPFKLQVEKILADISGV